jgi:hypothetical protein
VRYQIVIVFMIAAAAALGAFGIVYFAYHRLFDQQPPTAARSGAQGVVVATLPGAFGLPSRHAR